MINIIIISTLNSHDLSNYLLIIYIYKSKAHFRVNFLSNKQTYFQLFYNCASFRMVQKTYYLNLFKHYLTFYFGFFKVKVKELHKFVAILNSKVCLF